MPQNFVKGSFPIEITNIYHKNKGEILASGPFYDRSGDRCSHRGNVQILEFVVLYNHFTYCFGKG